MSATGLVYDPVFLEHDAGWGHPERRQRLEAIVTRLEQSGLMDDLVRIPAEPVDLHWLEQVHDPGYPPLVERVCGGIAGTVDLPTGDAPVCPASYDVARRAVGGVLAACDAIMDGTVRNAFCAVRPPGHHSRPMGGMGFCVFNNIAVAARYLQQQHGLERIAILDWDIHHGNGTQEAFYDDPSVLFCSTHMYPFYPGTGLASEQGHGDGEGFTINVPCSWGDGDEAVLDAFDGPFADATRGFRPDFVLVSAGYDAHAEDLLGGMNLSDEGYQRLAALVRDLAEECCDGRLLATLEGGYTIEQQARNVWDTIDVFHR